MAGALKSTSDGCTLVLTLSNPEFGNALSPDICAAGVEALNAAENNPEIRSVVITGEGSTFCDGSQWQRMLDQLREPTDAHLETADGLHSWVDSIRTFPKPVIAAVEMLARDAGFALALACDFLVAGDNAQFSMLHNAPASSPEGGASWSLMRSLPRALVAGVLMGGEALTAQRLHAAGLVNQLAPPGSVLPDALKLAEQLNLRAPNVLASIKELLNDAAGNPLSQQLASERVHLVRNLHHSNSRESIEAFLNNRTPRYR